ncbi:amino acid permease family protein [Metarhizium robertsii]|uniref:Amino acid permease family protein n=1 Tax=Metarhizium robertsii TaxID=568076 RepID=A0A014PNR7_9HYPO|nr:amino acid permease family protein [Metarhizium robertsii]
MLFVTLPLYPCQHFHLLDDQRPSLTPALPSGGSGSVVWGLVGAGICNMSGVARRVPVGVPHGRRAVSPGGHRLVQEREPRRRLRDGLAWLLGPLQGASALTGTSGALMPPHTFNAITAAFVVALCVTYAIPPAINILRSRIMLPANRSFRLPCVLGWISTWQVGVLWTVLTVVLFVFPPSIPVTASKVNYCILAFGFKLLIAGGTWVSDGRRHYQGPQLNSQGLMKGKLEMMEAAMGVNSSKKTQKAMLQGQVAAALL